MWQQIIPGSHGEEITAAVRSLWGAQANCPQHIFLGALSRPSPPFSPFLPFSALLPWINSPGPAELLTSRPCDQPESMGLVLETCNIIPLLLLLSTAGLGAWAGTWTRGVCLFRGQAAQRLLENTASQSGRISVAVDRGNLVAQMLFGGQQCFVTSGPAPIATCVSSICCTSSQCLARWRPSQPTDSGARCHTNAETSLSLDLKNDAIPLFQHRTMACPEATAECSSREGCGGQVAEQMGWWLSRWGVCMQANGAQPGSAMLAGASGPSSLERRKVLWNRGVEVAESD